MVIAKTLKIMKMKKLLSISVMFLVVFAGMSQEKRKVFGKVSDGKKAMESVNIQVLDDKASTTTDAEGKYEIMVETGDKLQYSFNGMKTITIRIEDVTRILNPIMIPDIEELEEVTVAASKRRSQKDLEENYVINQNIIRTAFGYLDAKRAAGQIRFLTEDEINPVNLCVLDLLRNRFAGLRVIGNCQTGGEVFNRRGSRSGPMIWDIDGQIFAFGGSGLPSAPVWLDINNIKRMAILNNLATTVQYGYIGASGVIVINTITGNPYLNQIVDRARLRNNYVSGKVLTKTEVMENAPTYQKELETSGSFAAARATFDKYENTFSNSPYFYLDAYRHFADKWNELDYADTIIEENYGLFIENPVLLKALAYAYDEQGRTEKANDTYKEVFILRPNYAQSYFDMANSYRDLKEPRQAALLYARYDYLLEEGFMEMDTLGFGPVINREFNNLLTLERNAVVEGRKARKLFVDKNDVEGTRLVFEWNDGEAEFELQFVNPENQYYKWKHTLADNADIITREKDYGYNIKEEQLDGSLPGLWKVNVNYLGNKSLTPTYLKATVYHNYGTRAQRKEVRVYKLNIKNVNQQLFTLGVNGAVATK